MALIVHLSDLHMAPDVPAQSGIFDGLVRALHIERKDRQVIPEAIHRLPVVIAYAAEGRPLT
jgi:hypothetical protein